MRTRKGMRTRPLPLQGITRDSLGAALLRVVASPRVGTYLLGTEENIAKASLAEHQGLIGEMG